MRAWLYCLAGLIIWAGHFFALYATGSVFPGTLMARWIVLALTILALVLLILLAHRIRERSREAKSSPTRRWLDSLAGLVAAISMVSVIFQVFPAIIG